jgi:hypothetical protein
VLGLPRRLRCGAFGHRFLGITHFGALACVRCPATWTGTSYD